MSGLQTANLDAYSRIALPMILNRFPDWEQHGKLTSSPDGSGDTVEFNIPCPSAAVECGLWVATFDEELTVGFHTHHAHFTDYENRGANEQEIERGLQQADDILNERLGVVTWYRGEAMAGSSTLELPPPGLLPDMFGRFGDAPTKLAKYINGINRVTLRSWRGQYDREERRE